MLERYGLKAFEYLFYAIAGLAAVELLRVQSTQPDWANDLCGIIFILGGIGILLPRIVAYLCWHYVTANVGPYRDDWDGDISASYSYEFNNQIYRGRFRSLNGSPRYSRLQVSVNPSAPSVRYAVFWNVWVCGAVMFGFGVFVLVREQNFFG